MYRRLNQSKLLSFKYRINILFLNLIINIGIDSQSKYRIIDSQSMNRFLVHI